MNNADDKTIYQFKDYVTNIPTSAFVPTLEDSAMTNEQKVIIPKNAFFPLPSQTDLRDISQAEYLAEIQYDSRVSIRQIREAVNKSAPNKAPGSDVITNKY